MAGTCWLCGGPAHSHPLGARAATGYRCARCGNFGVSWQVESLASPPERLKQLASIVTRSASDSGAPAVVLTDWFSNPEAHGLIPLPVTMKLQQLLFLLARRSSRFGDLVQVSKDDVPLVGALDVDELNALLGALKESRAVRFSAGEPVGRLQITPSGWEDVERLQRPCQGRQTFVAMWFDPSMDTPWSAGFEPGIRDAGLEPLRIDKKLHNNKIDDEIIVEIRRSRVLVADVTGQRAGVYFEAGFAKGLGLPVIWCVREDDLRNVHFDTRQFNHVVWTTPEHLRQQLVLRLRAELKLP